MKLKIEVKAIDRVYARELLDQCVMNWSEGHSNIEPLAAVCAELRIHRAMFEADVSQGIDDHKSPDVEDAHSDRFSIPVNQPTDADKMSKAELLIASLEQNIEGIIDEAIDVRDRLNKVLGVS